MSQKVAIQHLPLAASTVQSSLTRLPLEDTPTSQRRSTTFQTYTKGVWARVNPLWSSWPLRITKEEVEEMGIDLAGGGKVSVEDVLARWDPVDVVEEGSGGLRVTTSKHRNKLEGQLLGISPLALQDSLPHLESGDASQICNDASEPEAEGSKAAAARDALFSVLSGRWVLDKADDEYGPWSTRYCGHQFGSWAGQLGDGRAISLLETQSSAGRTEIQLKGGGRTPFSRTADGLAVLRSGVREFLGCEAIAALGIPTTRSLALLMTPGLPVIRENGPEPPSLLARLAPSFIRIGHFEALNPGEAGRSFAQIFIGGGWAREDEDDGSKEGPLNGQGNLEGLRELAEWGKEMLGIKGSSTKEFVEEVIKRNAEMVGQWQVYGWMHGVLNTDNISILGITIDYGPYAFMDVFDEGHICNHSDPSGLYSYRRQPERVLFALDKLASALGPLIGYESQHGPAAAGWSESKTVEDVKQWNTESDKVMQGWEDAYWKVERETESNGWLQRFGLKTHRDSDDRDVIYDLLVLLRMHSLDFHAIFRRLSQFKPSRAEDNKYIRTFAANLIADSTISLRSDGVDKAIEEIRAWLDLYARRVLESEEMAAWEQHATSDAERARTGEQADEDWEAKREVTMKAVNPRFVLRQWVLEDVISKMEDSIDDIKEMRKILARILDMSTKPFLPYGEQSEGSSEEEKTRTELCGLGSKQMLGFQCSCSS